MSDLKGTLQQIIDVPDDHAAAWERKQIAQDALTYMKIDMAVEGEDYTCGPCPKCGNWHNVGNPCG